MGMPHNEVEAILGPTGLSYSSSYFEEYYIVRGKDGWSRIWVRQEKVWKLSFDASLSVGGKSEE
jgi:hypothetical protein